jgi:hypothetical protein
MDRANADCFLADVVSIDGTIFTIQPLIKEFDGTPHIEVTAISRDGVTPGIGDNLTVGSNADVTGNVGIDGILTLAGTNMNLHIHQAGALISAAPGNPVTGVTGLMV